MKIATVTLQPCVLRKEDPHWRFALGASPTTEGVIVTLASADGVQGFGYGSATAHMGAAQSALSAALERLTPLVVGRDTSDIADVMNFLDAQMPDANQAKAALDCALHDLKARTQDIPLYCLLGEKVRDSVPILRILAIKTPEEMAANARKLVAKGYLYLKIKLEGRPHDDIARVRAIREAVGDDIHLTVDANQSYSVNDAIAALTHMAQFGVELAEQPIAAADLEGLKQVTDCVPVVVEADESASSVERVKELVEIRAVDAVSLKIPKLGGLLKTIEAARICETGGVGYRMGAAVGSRLLSAQAMHLAAVLPKIEFACELGEFDRLLDDPFTGIAIENGHLALPETPGSGVVLRDDFTLKGASRWADSTRV